MMKTKSLVLSLLLSVTLMAGSASYGDTITLTGSQSFTSSSYSFLLSAQAQFNLQGSNLSVTLTNTSANDINIPAEILTGVFFNLPSSVSLDPVQALLASGSTVLNGPINGGNLSSEWAYNDGMTNPGNAVFLPLGNGIEGISSSGLGLFGPGDRFDTAHNLQGPASVGGMEYGITSAGDNPATGNSPLMTNALIHNSMVFSFNVDGAFDLNSVRDVVFQYGTSTSEPSFRVFRGQPRPPVPEPSTIALLGMGILGIALRKKFTA